MRVLAISRHGSAENRQLIIDMHKLRARIFKGRLDWEVSIAGDMEIDVYDSAAPTYLIGITDTNAVVACARLLPTIGPNMLTNTFPALLGRHRAPASPKVFESSRFCVDRESLNEIGLKGLNEATFSMLAAVLEWGLANDQEAVVTVTDVRFERILQRAQWPLERFAPPMQIGDTRALAGRLPITLDALTNVRQTGGLSGAVLSFASDNHDQAA